MNTDFEIVARNIKERATTKAMHMDGTKVSDDAIQQILALADAAPTHGRTEPWRFVVYDFEHKSEFGLQHSNIYWEHTPEETRNLERKQVIQEMGKNASHIIVAIMKRTEPTKIPKWEEEAATAAAIQNILLGASALGISAIWNTGGMVWDEAMKKMYNLNEEDRIMGVIYLGNSVTNQQEKTRKISLDDKITWIK